MEKLPGPGAYDAGRASSLAGVPESTLYEWARGGLIRPSVSPEKLKLWSWTDLVAARAIYWLRHPAPGNPRRPTSMAKVRELVRHLESMSFGLGDSLAQQSLRLSVDGLGMPHIELAGLRLEGSRHFTQLVAAALVEDLLAPFPGVAGAIGPDLRRPAPHVSIDPGALSGEPHIEGTRIETRVVYALHERGYSEAEIVDLYGGIERSAVREAISLERALARNQRRLAA